MNFSFPFFCSPLILPHSYTEKTILTLLRAINLLCIKILCRITSRDSLNSNRLIRPISPVPSKFMFFDSSFFLSKKDIKVYQSSSNWKYQIFKVSIIALSIFKKLHTLICWKLHPKHIHWLWKTLAAWKIFKKVYHTVMFPHFKANYTVSK